MACVDETQRYRGQKDAGSSTALRLTGLGETLVLALLALICLAFWAAPSSAKTHTADPAPQQAPAAQSPGSPSPDPAPQAAALEAALALRPAVAQDRFAVGAATLSLLCAYAEQAPVAVLVDDVQWLDGSSAQALLFAFRRLLADPIAVLVAVREGEPSLLDGSGLPVLRLGGLTSDEAAGLMPGPPVAFTICLRSSIMFMISRQGE